MLEFVTRVQVARLRVVTTDVNTHTAAEITCEIAQWNR